MFTVKDLKEMIKDLPDDMELIETRCSDYQEMNKDNWAVVKGVDQWGQWIMRSHPTMSENNKEREKLYLHYAGN